MNKKRFAIIIALLAVLAVTGYFFIDGINQAYAKQERYLFGSYRMQNEAFFDWGKGEYMPYDAAYDTELQIHINAYTRKAGQMISIDDVKTFLEERQNPDGSPRTWENDSGIIYDFVRWCGYNAMDMFDYRESLSGVLTRYNEQYPDCPYNKLSDLSVDQINELDKKLDDPNYDLDLESLK